MHHGGQNSCCTITEQSKNASNAAMFDDRVECVMIANGKA